MGTQVPLLLVALVATASAGPAGLTRQRCATTCSDSTKFAFEKGMTYEYDYEVATTTRDFPLDSEDSVSFTTKAKASISVVAPCEFVLTLTDVSLEGSAHSSEFSSALMKNPLRFSFNDGKITELCSQTKEQVWVTNFKRGVLSMFQNTMENFDKEQTTSEVDIIGECEAEYNPVRDGDMVTIERTKSFEKCKHVAMTSHTTLPKALQKLPLLSSRETCSQKIDAGITKEVICNQNLILKPISGNDGVATAITTKLVFVSSTYGVSTSDFELKKTSLEFDGTMIEDGQEVRIQVVEEILNELDDKSQLVVKVEVPELFSKLVDNLRHLDERQMQLLYESNKFSRVWRFLVDAAPMVATSASMSIMSDLVTSAEISQEDANIWFSSMAFINKPEPGMFTKLGKTIKVQNTEEALLGVSAMVKAFCSMDASCMENESIRDVVMQMEVNLGSSCRSYSLEKRELILITLKALGKAGRFINHEILESCYTEKSIPAEVRVAALESEKNMPCDHDNSKLHEVFSDVQEDYEIRIAAYLSMMACPTKELIQTVKSRLSSEGVNHVGSFIWSHMSNLQETASHEKQWIRELIGEEALASKFNSTSLKLSRNYESSFYMEEQGFGTTIESNIIFSKNSILPRSGMLDLSVDIFGESLNMIEIGGRMEGFESLIEKFFGPNGYYPEETVETIVKGLRKSQTNDDVTTLEDMLETATDNPEGSYYMNVLGNEIIYHHFHGLENFFDNKVDFNLIGMIMELARTGKVDHTKTYNLVDTELTYPTISGFPLSLKLNGTATIGMQMDGKFSATSFRDIDIEGYVYPSATVQMDATMLIDTHVSKFGRKMSANIHTANQFDGKIKVMGGKLVDIKINAPKEKMEIFSFKGEKVFVNGNVETKEESESTNKVINLTVPLGITLEKKIEYNNNEFVLSYGIDKTDTQSSYTMRFVNEPNTIEFTLDTPGSSIDRKFSFVASKTETSVNLDIYTPFKKLSGSGTHELTNNGKKYAMEFTVDDTKHYKLAGEYDMTYDVTNKFNSLVSIESPNGVIMASRGMIEHDKESRSVKIDFEQSGLIPATIKAQVSCTDTTKNIDVDISSSIITTTVSGKMNLDENRKSTQFDGKYSIMNGPQHTFSKYFKLQKVSTVDERSYLIDFSQEYSQFPSLGLSIQGKHMHTKGNIESSASVQTSSEVFDITLKNVVSYDFTDESKAYQYNISLMSSSNNIDFIRNENFKLRSNYLLRDTFMRIFPGYDVVSKTELGYFRDVEAFARVSLRFPELDTSHEYSYTKVADRHYTAQVLNKVNSFEMALDGSFQERSQPGQLVDLLMGTKLNVNGDKRDAEFGLKVDDSSLSLDVKANFEGLAKFVKIRGTMNSLTLESNIIQPLLMEAKLSTNPNMSASIVGHWGSTQLDSRLVFENKMISGLFKYGQIQKSFRVEILDNGLKTEIEINPTENIKLDLSYDTQNGLYFITSLETPFDNFRKQDLVINFKQDGINQIEGQINVTWENQQVFVLTTRADVSGSSMANGFNFDLSIRGKKEFFGMDRFKFIVKHARTGYNIDSVMTGNLDGNEIITGKFSSEFTSDMQQINASLKTPVTEDFQLESTKLMYKKAQCKITYGDDFIHSMYSLESMASREHKFEYQLTSSLFEDFKFEIVVTKTDENKELQVEGQYGDYKSMIVFTNTKEITAEGMNLQSTGRITLPNRSPITGSLTTNIMNKLPEKQITTNFEMTRFWSTYGSFKIHNSITYVTKTNFKTLTSITSPDIKASMESMVEFEENNLNSFVKYSLNGQKGHFTANGTLNVDGRNANIRTTGVTKDEVLFKIDFDYEMIDSKHVTKIKAKCGSRNFNIHHEFSFTDKVNWTNEFYINEYYFQNIMKYNEATVSHAFDWNLNSNFIRGDVSYSSQHMNDININSKLSNSWTQDIAVAFKYEATAEIYRPDVTVSYGSHKMNFNSVFTYTRSELSIVSDFVSSFYDDIHLLIKTNPINIGQGIHMLMNVGETSTTVDLSGKYNYDEKSAVIKIKSTILPTDINIETAYLSSGRESIVNVAVTTDRRNAVKIVHSGFDFQGKLTSDVELPCIDLQGVQFTLDYDFIAFPYILHGKLNRQNKQSEEYSAKITIGEKSIITELDLDRTDMKFGSEWNFNESQKFFNIFASSNALETTSSIKCQFNTDNSDFEFVTKYNSEVIFSAIAKHEGILSKYEMTVWYWLQTLYKASISFDSSNFTGYFSIDEQKVTINGEHNFNYSSGSFLCTINSSFNNFNKFTLNGDYDLAQISKINLSASVDDKMIETAISTDFNDVKAPNIEIKMKTFIESFKTIGMKASYDIKTSMKTLSVEINRNDDHHSWKLVAIKERIGKGKIILEAKTPIVEYESMRYGFDYEFTEKTIKATLLNVVNSVNRSYFIEVQHDSNSVNGVLQTPGQYGTISFDGNYENKEDEMKYSANVIINNNPRHKISVNGMFSKNVQSPSVKCSFEMKSPGDQYYVADLELHGKILPQDIELHLKLERNADTLQESEIHTAFIVAKQMYKKGDMHFDIVSPFIKFSNISMKGGYNFLDDVKHASIQYEVNGVQETFAVDLSVNNNHFVVNVVSPLPKFENMSFEGDFTDSNNMKTVMAKLTNGPNKYKFEGFLDLNRNEFTFRGNMPNTYEKLEITGKTTPTGYIVTSNVNNETKEIIFDYNIESNSVSYRLQTPFAGYRNLAFEYQMKIRSGSMRSVVKFEKDDFTAELQAKMRLTNLKSNFIVSGSIPKYNQDFTFNASYDLTENIKFITISAKHNEQEHKLAIDLRYDASSADMHVSIPFINKNFGANYSFNIDKENMVIEGLFNVVFNEKEYKFSSNVEVNPYEFMKFKLTTPFEGIEKIEAKASINRGQRIGKLKIVFGEYEISSMLKYSPYNFLFEIVSPFELLKSIKLSSTIINSNELREINMTANYNSDTIKFSAGQKHRNLFMEFIHNAEISRISVTGEMEQEKASLHMSMQTPFEHMRDISFTSKIDISAVDKFLEITMQNENDVKMVSISGKFIDDEAELKVKTPFVTLENFQTRASLSRSKRSVEFMIMKDTSLAEIHANFNSLNINVRTPYEKARESTLTVERTDAGGLELHYKRGDNYIDLTAVPTGRRRSFDVTIGSAFPGWEYLALAGRLDKDELIGYLSGQINEDKMTIQGGGKYSRVDSDLNFDITTPYAGYESITFKLKFNVRRNQFIFDMKSSSSEFRIFVSTVPNFTVDIYVPNPAEPTIISANMSIFNSNVKISSRFPKVRSFNLNWELKLKKGEVEINSGIEYNGLQVFELEFKRGGGTAHFKIDARRGDNHSMIHFHRVGFEELEFVFNRNGKEFKAEAKGSGNLPTKGSIDIVINNSFREVPRTVTGRFELDRTGSPKTAKLELVYPGNKLYVINVSYNIDLSRPTTGDYKISIMTPERRAYPWNNINGSWDFTDHDNAVIVFGLQRLTITARGKFGLRESNFTVTTSRNRTPYIVQWRFYKTSSAQQRTRDYLLKIGPTDRFLLFKLKGTFNGAFFSMRDGDAEIEFQSPRMSDKISLNMKWKRDNTGLSGDGSFTYGDKSGTFNLKRLKRFAETRSLVLSFEANTNIPNYSKITVEGEYSFNNEAVVKLDINWDTDKISINFNVNDITSEFTQQTASFSLPGFDDITVEFGHDFRNKRARKFTAIANVGGRESFIKAEWNRNKDFTKLSGTIDVQSIFLGTIKVVGSYDVRNLNNAKAEFDYKRNDDKFVNIKWTRVYSSKELNAEVVMQSHFVRLPTAKIVVTGEFDGKFIFNILLQLNTRTLTFDLSVIPNSITGKFTSPIPGFEEVTGSLTYDFSNKKKKTAQLRYVRGDKTVNMDFDLNIPNRRKGQLSLTLETPFEIIRTLSATASWENNRGEVHYKRNDIEYHFEGTADVRSNKSSFEITFNPPDQEEVTVALEFNSSSFLEGRGTEPEKIAKVVLGMLGKRIEFELEGFRNSERIMVHLDIESTFERLREFEIKLDSELNTQQRDGLFELTVNDFHFRMRNHFERKTDGYYFKTEIDSTVTPLPGITLGFGRDGEERILTVGVGEERELTVSFASKNNFKNGFSGKLSLPRRGIEQAAYDVNYKFTGNDVLNIDTKIEIEPGKVIEADIVYNSDGVKGRLQSSGTSRSARMRRSISDNKFFVDVGIDDYSVTLLAEKILSNKGFLIEGEVFGKKISIDSLFLIEGISKGDARFMINTNIDGYENIGGILSYRNGNGKVLGRAEINLPSYVTPRMSINVNFDANNGFKGLASMDLSGEMFKVETNLNGNMRGGYNGSIKINTPFHVASEISIDTTVNIDPRDFKLQAMISHPQGYQNISFSFKEMSPLSYVSDAKFECNGKTAFTFGFDVDLTRKEIKSHVSVTDHKLTIDVSSSNDIYKAILFLDSTFISDPVEIILSKAGNLTSNQSFNGVITTKGESHSISVTCKFIKKEIDASMIIQSSIFNGRKMFTISHEIPSDYRTESFAVQMSYISDYTYDLVTEVDRTNGFTGSVTFTSPVGVSKIQVSGYKMDKKFGGGILFINPFTKHDISLDVEHSLYKANNILQGNVELNLNTNYGIQYKMKLERSDVKYIVEQFLKANSYEHFSKIGYSYTARGILLVVDFDTPLFNINSGSFVADARINSHFKRVIIKLTRNDEIHTCDIKIDLNEINATAVLKSPYIAGDVAKAEVSASGSMEKMATEIMVRYNKKMLGAKFGLEVNSSEDIRCTLEVKTPFRGYRKMNFGASFVKDSFTTVSFYALQPIGYKFALTTGKTVEEFITEVDIETPIDGFEVIAASVKAPLTKVAPKLSLKLPTTEYGMDFAVEKIGLHNKVSGSVNLNGLIYGAGVGYRNSPPFEFSYHARTQNFKESFQIMMDSSFFSLFSLCL